MSRILFRESDGDKEVNNPRILVLLKNDDDDDEDVC